MSSSPTPTPVPPVTTPTPPSSLTIATLPPPPSPSPISSQPNCTPDPKSRFVTLDPVFFTYYLGLLAVVMMVNVVGNLLVLTTISRHRSLWQPSNIFICSLALSDLLFAPAFYCYNVAGIITPGVKDVFGDWTRCRVLLMEVLALEICSAYTLVAITVVRYISTHFALRYHHFVTVRTCSATVAVIWITSHAACAIVYAVERPEAVVNGKYCQLCRYERIYTQREVGLLTVFQFAIPFTIMVVFYLQMICEARRLNKRVTIESFCTNDAGSEVSRAYLRQRQHKSFMIIALLIGCFAFSYLPLIVYFSLVISNPDGKNDHEYLSATSRIFLAFNTAVNVFIYAGRMGDFRIFLHRDLSLACPSLARYCSWSSGVQPKHTSMVTTDVNVVAMTSPRAPTRDPETESQLFSYTSSDINNDEDDDSSDEKCQPSTYSSSDTISDDGDDNGVYKCLPFTYSSSDTIKDDNVDTTVTTNGISPITLHITQSTIHI